MRLALRVRPRGVVPGPSGTVAGDEGITLLEVVVSLLIIAVVMSAAAGFFINGLRSTGGQSARQVSISLTNQQLETVTAIPPTQLLAGRTLAVVNALLTTDTGRVLTGRDDTSNATSTSLDYDATATASSTPVVAPTAAVTQNNVAYQRRTFINPCWIPTGTAYSVNATRNIACVAASTPPLGAPGVSMEYRVTVSTSWVGGPGTNCSGGCSFNDSTLVDPNKDATFNSNVSQPTLTGVTPSPVGASSAPTLLLTGTNFVAGATVYVTCNGCSATVGTIDPATNTGASIKVPVTFASTAGTATIRLTNPDGGSATIMLTVNPAPAVTSYSPSVVLPGTATTVRFAGTSLSAASTVTASAGTVTASTYSAGVLSFTYTGMSSTPMPVFTVTNADGGTTTVSGISVKPPVLSYVNDTSTQISYGTGWGYSSNRNATDYNLDVHVAGAAGSSAVFSFTGVSVVFLTENYNDEGQFLVSLDGGPPVTLSGYAAGPRQCQVPAYSASDLLNGPHTLKITSVSGYTLVDAFQIGTAS